MPVSINGTVCYSLAEISAMSGIAASDVAKKAAESGLELFFQGSLAHVRRENLPEFFELLYGDKAYTLKYRLPSYLRSSPEPWCATLRNMYVVNIARPSSLSPQQGEFLRSLVTNSNPKTVVEIGTFFGISSIWIAAALQDAANGGRLYSIDLFKDILPLPNGRRTKCILDPMQKVADNVARAGLQDCVTLIQGDSRVIGEKWAEISSTGIDLLYIDGDHSIEGCLADFKLFSPHLNPGGFIVLHDIYPANCSCDGPRFLLDMLNAKAKLQTFELETSPHNFGMAVFRIASGWTPRREVLK